MTVKCKAYGKILVFGAYSILEPGNIGLVVNVNKGTAVTVNVLSSGKYVLDLKNYNITVKGKRVGNLLQLAEEKETLKFVRCAVESCFEYLNSMSKQIKDIEIITENDPELSPSIEKKTGFGSSATSTVATVASVLKQHDIEGRDIVYSLSRQAHFRAQGSGSGFDIASACFGSGFFVKDNYAGQSLDKIKEGDFNYETYDWPLLLIPVIIFTGKSASTKTLVEKVMKFKFSSEKKYYDLMEKYNSINIKARQAFTSNDPKNIKRFLEESWAMRKKLGQEAKAEIEPDAYTKMINEIKDNGAYTAGLVGAGGGDSILALCTNKKEKEKLIKYLDSKSLVYFEDMGILSRGYEFL